MLGSGTTEFVCVEGIRFGREPKCVRGKTVILDDNICDNVGMIRVYWATSQEMLSTAQGAE